MNTSFFVAGERPNNTFHQMSAATNYLQNDSPLKLLVQKPHSLCWHSESQYLLMMNKSRERPHKSAPAKGEKVLIQRLTP